MSIYEKIKSLIKQKSQDINHFFNTENDNPKIEKARKEILNLFVILPFPVISYLFINVYCSAFDLTQKNGSGLIFTGFIIIYLVWAFVVVRTNKGHKPHSHHNQE